MANEEWTKVGGGEQVEAWDPQKGDEVVGKYVEKRTDLGAKKSTMYIVEKTDGSKIGIWGSTVLTDRFSKANLGDMVKVIYTGKYTSKNGNTVKGFDFYFKPGTGATPTASVSSPAVNTDDLPF